MRSAVTAWALASYRARLERARRMRVYLAGGMPIEGLYELTRNEGDLPI